MTDDDVIEYADWGERFFAAAVTTERVLAGVNALAGQPIDVGPLGVGPGRVAKVTAQGRIGTATGERIATDPIGFAVRLPVTLEFALDLGVDVQRFTAEIVVPLRLTARGRGDLAIQIDVDAPQPSEVSVRLEAQGLRASITKHAANVEGELQRFVAKYVGREIDKPQVRAARLIDVAAAVDRAVSGFVTRPSGPEVSSKFSSALAVEIQEQESLFLDQATTEDGA